MESTLPTISVMVVDDSAVIRGMITREIQQDPRIKVVSSAMTGRFAIEAQKKNPVDIILLDVEMPEMDGLTALPELLKISPKTKIIMVSNLTQKGASHTMTALERGASECIGKPSNQRDRNESTYFFTELRDKIIALGIPGAPLSSPHPAPSAPAKATAAPKPQLTPQIITMAKCSAIAIGSSTGGPQALLQLFKALPPQCIKVPIFITQHMPATFTKTLANHIKEASGIPCQEAAEGDVIQSGHIYIAPGDYHMEIKRDGTNLISKLNQNPPINFCRPSVDPMFMSLADIYGQNLLAIMLTGMGQDGLDGSRKVHETNGKIIIQERNSCVVWGMPKAVSDAGIADSEMMLPEIAQFIQKVMA